MSTYTAVIVNALFISASVVMPKLAMKYVIYKCRLRDRDVPGVSRLEDMMWSLIGALGGVLFCCLVCPGSNGAVETVMKMILFEFALFGSYVDQRLHIIGNEMVLVMFVYALIYRGWIYGPVTLLPSLLTLLMNVGVMALAGVATYLHKGVRGVGAGDIKLVMVISFVIGFNMVNIGYFWFGLIVGMGVYFLVAFINPILKITMNTRFAMCPMIMTGMLFGIAAPYYDILGFGA